MQPCQFVGVLLPRYSCSKLDVPCTPTRRISGLAAVRLNHHHVFPRNDWPNYGCDRVRDLDGFDPQSILGVPSNASFDDIRAAWHRLAKIYHPDRYSNAELPGEVREYLASMARRVNAAYAALEAPQLAVKRSSAARAAPIYTSSTRS